MYAKVVNDVIVEFPITDIDYETNRYLESGIVPVVLPIEPTYDTSLQSLVMNPLLMGDIVMVSYTIHDYTIDELLLQSSAITGVTISTIPPALLSAIVVRTKERIQGMLDTFAQTRDYDNIASCISYKTSSITSFQTEALRCEYLRDITWSNLNTYLTNIMNGTNSIPTLWSEISVNLPALTWV